MSCETKIGHFSAILPSQSLQPVLKKLNITGPHQVRTSKLKHKVTRNKQKQNPSFVTLYDSQPGNRTGLFLQYQGCTGP